MAIFDYGIGGNEVNVDANESIADIPSNRTLLVQKLTDEAPVSPETVYGLQTVEDVFEHFSPSVQLEMQNDSGEDVTERMHFKNPETRQAVIDLLQSSLDELNNLEAK